jgi:Ca2+-binding RTX toxin-like protein
MTPFRRKRFFMSSDWGARRACLVGWMVGSGALACAASDGIDGPNADPVERELALAAGASLTHRPEASEELPALLSETRMMALQTSPDRRRRLPTVERNATSPWLAPSPGTDTNPRPASIQRLYAALQLGSEALFTFRRGQADEAAPPGTTRSYSKVTDSGHLQAGNDRASRMTDGEAELLRDWDVVQHRSNTSTGFSGTLFRYGGPNDPARALQSGQLVLSLRSTEFIDDSARDNQATNSMEVFEAGWAFGQIADMIAWFEELRSDAIPEGVAIDVTGYSLGGHLATAFRLLFPNVVRSVYTFNGAGVGEVLNDLSLADVMEIFQRLRRSDNGVGDLFSIPEIRALYEQFRPRLDVPGSRATSGDLQAVNDLLTVNEPPEEPGIDPVRLQEVSLLLDALTRKNAVLDYNQYVRMLTSGAADSLPPAVVPDTAIDATRLDYQVASLVARRNTRGASLLAEGLLTLRGRRRTVEPVTPNFFDVFGATFPSIVASSQFHHGVPTPVFIEDQPRFRGTLVSDAALASFQHSAALLLVDEFVENDFGDTHSIVLMTDALGIEDALSRLEPRIAAATFDSIFQGASSLVTVTDGTQGFAEGDVLENVLTALRRALLSTAAPSTPFDVRGGTWADFERRQLFHRDLAELTQLATFNALRGRVRVEVPSRTLGALARDDFGAFAALELLSPVALVATDAENRAFMVDALRPAWGDTTSLWELDKNRSSVERTRAGTTFSDTWFADRAALASAITLRNQRNLATTELLDPSVPNGLEYEFRFVELDSPSGANAARVLRVQRPSARPLLRLVWFGTNGDDTLAGNDEPLGDHLFGAGGSDTLNGRGGPDHLEGNAGDDTVNGDVGADTLIGGSGLDVLDGGDDGDTLIGGDNADFMIGGAGDDVLYGGAGRDNYDFGPDFGHDVIDDSDGDGVLRRQGLGEIGAGTARRINEGVWETEDRSIRYTLLRAAGGRTDLAISFSDDPGTILIQNYSDQRSLGIRLPTSIAPPTPPPSTLRGDFHKQTEEDDPTTDFDESTRYVDDPESPNYVADGDEANVPDLIEGTPDADWIQGLGGDDGLAGGEGDDLLEGGDGGDVIMAGAGADTVLSGNGPDVIYGSGSATFVYPTLTTTLPPPPSGPVLGTGLSWVTYLTQPDRFGFDSRFIGGVPTLFDVVADDGPSIIESGAGDDTVLTGNSADIAQLGPGIDIALGMADDDAIFGGDGNDQIGGDGPHTNLVPRFTDTPGPLHGRDLLAGEGGNDVLLGHGNDDVLYGGDGEDRIYGDDDALTFTPVDFHGADYIEGGDGSDIALGGGSDDIVLGGDGNDLLWGDDLATDVPETNHGSDYLDGGNGSDQLVGGAGSDVLSGGSGNDRLFGDDDPGNIDEAAHAGDQLEGGDGDDYLESGGGDDIVSGDAGSDTVFAGEGADLLLGGDGTDFLNGEADDDTLSAGPGADYVAGGPGDDSYLVRSTDLTFASAGPVEFIDDTQGTNTVVFEDRAATAVELLVLDPANLAIGVGEGRYVIVNTSASDGLRFAFLDGTFTLAELFALPR